MTDSHMRILAAVARHRERKRDDYETSASPSPQRAADLSHRAVRARKQVSAARARRRLATGDEPDS